MSAESEVLLAAGGSRDWIQGVILLLVVGLPVLNKIVKAIAAKLSGTEDETEAPTPPQHRDRSRPPVARARGSKPQPAHQPPPPVARPQPPRPAVSPPRRSAPQDAPPPAFAPLIEMIRERIEERPRVRQQQRPGPKPEEKPQRKPVRSARPSSTKKRKQRESIAEREQRLAKQGEERMGHVREGLVTPVVERPSDHRHMWMTRQSLRRAIVLSEILAPPLALRPPVEERW
ncbi:MAG: hypothetical protein IID35_01935 [Planctomycetes bacterium]|nr:hypothetical protein [Planctomycetota bacterium]